MWKDSFGASWDSMGFYATVVATLAVVSGVAYQGYKFQQKRMQEMKAAEQKEREELLELERRRLAERQSKITTLEQANAAKEAKAKAEKEAKAKAEAEKEAKNETSTPVQTSTEQAVSSYMDYFKSSTMIWGGVVLALLVVACIAYAMLSSGVDAEALVEEGDIFQEVQNLDLDGEEYDDLTTSQSSSHANTESAAMSATMAQ